MAARILAVETSTRACSVALLWDGECREILRLERNRHAEILIPMARELLAHGDCRFEQLDTVAFGSGPGSFTGLRIGISVVQGLAFGIDRPVVPVSSLLALATRINSAYVLAGIDARMHQLYWNVYERVGGYGMRALQEPRVSGPTDIRLPGGEEWTAAGTGCDVYRAALMRMHTADVEFAQGVHPHAGDVARIAESEYVAGNAVDAGEAAPEYVRNDIVQGR
ncbi:MAG: tRNA threonylcarbamoyladenosine biosynthesis protein TsaB [Gammaproteobacteria bacterium]|nr:tRNA threonylcarbamoyladenosine biosynthesis protein TsaB [Gammaproteobacteria bacterium]